MSRRGKLWQSPPGEKKGTRKDPCLSRTAVPTPSCHHFTRIIIGVRLRLGGLSCGHADGSVVFPLRYDQQVGDNECGNEAASEVD